MAKSLIRIVRCIACALGALIGCASVPTHALAGSQNAASGIADPTTPPPGYGPPSLGTDPRHAEAGANTSADANRLQMILVQGEKRSAVIGGRTVHVGDTVAIEGSAARVERIDEGALVVQQGDARKVLHLIEDSAGVRRKPQCLHGSTDASGCRTQ
ncbi:MAG TPA: hypothetical protein VEK74_04875 [Burkholderiaceae bacterium]|nr:hypothetical protein [Burkholderiaceae bacterium]